MGIKKENIENIPCWYFSEINSLSEIEYLEMNLLIDTHLADTKAIIQFHNSDQSIKSIKQIIITTQKNKLKPIYIHIYKCDKNTISIYVNGDI